MIQKTAEVFEHFFNTIRRLRAPDGCPWDIEQTPLSMRSALIEECFEAVEAITAQNAEHAKEELGDVFLNAAMISYMYEQDGSFSTADVLNTVTEKLIRRHPHVFPESAGKSQANGAKTAAQVLTQWEAIKKSIEGRAYDSILDEVSKGLPPLLRAYKLQKKAAKKGFDWNTIQPVFNKIREELAEVEDALAALQSGNDLENTQGETPQLHLEEEIGDLLFAVVNAARHLHIEPETALSRTNAKFCRRFKYVEQQMNRSNMLMDSEHMAQMDAFWEEAKNAVDETP